MYTRRLGQPNWRMLCGKFLASLLAILTCLSLCMTVVFAASDDKKSDNWELELNPTDTAKADKYFDESCGIAGLSYSSGKFTWDGGMDMSALTQKEQKKQVKKFMDNLGKASLSSQATSGLTALLGETDDGATVEMSILLLPYIMDETKGDVLGGMQIVRGFLPYINVLIGIVAILLMSLLVFSTVLDLAFIGLPQFREWILGGKEGGDGKAPKGITYAARHAVDEVEGGGAGGGSGSGKNIYLTYFKKRIFDYILLGICLAFLVLGGFSRFFSALLEIGSGLTGG